MRVRRNIASIPVRSAKETWIAIIDLVADAESKDREQLLMASSTMESLIADEYPAKAPIVFKGSGPRILIYCLYNEAAMDAGVSIDSLSSNPTADDWQATAPAEAEDVAWMNKTLEQIAPRITVHDVDQAPEEDSKQSNQMAKELEIDWGAIN